MKFHLLSTLAIAITPSVTCGLAFTPFKFPNPKDFLTRALREATQIEVITGVGLPTDTENMKFGQRFLNFAQGSIQTNKDVLGFLRSDEFADRLHESLAEEKPLSKNISVEPKWSDAVRKTFAYGINNVIKVHPDDADPAEGYLYFGNRDFKKILPMLCQVNPFYASALTVSKDQKHLELVAFTDAAELKEEPLYLSLMREMVDDSHKINAKFDKSMNLVEITKYDSETGKAVVVPKEEWDYYSSGILYNLFYHASTIHANIHILHYLMCACIVASTRDTNDSLEKWADIYDDNIAIKYVEVAALLFEATVAGKPFEPRGKGKKLVSGQDGFGATPKIMDKVRDMQFKWGSLKTEKEYTRSFLQEGIYMTAESEEAAEKILAEANILTEFNKHRDNVTPFAEELSDALRKLDPEAHAKAEESIKSFMSACGRGVSSIDSISSWLQLMSMTGLTHGSTLSYTRLILVPEIIRWRNIHKKEFDDDDLNLMNGGFGTLQGMTLDRHVFTGEIKHGWVWEVEKIDQSVRDVLDKYDGKALDLKLKYEEEIKERDDFREYGWILTDHCQDGYDGKQHTITTYI